MNMTPPLDSATVPGPMKVLLEKVLTRLRYLPILGLLEMSASYFPGVVAEAAHAAPGRAGITQAGISPTNALSTTSFLPIVQSTFALTSGSNLFHSNQLIMCN